MFNPISKIRSKISYKIIALFISIFLVFTVLLNAGNNLILDSVFKDLQDVAKEQVIMVQKELDTDQLKGIISEMYENSAAYQTFREKIYNFKGKHSISNIYILVKKDEDNAEFIADFSNTPAEMGKAYEMDEYMKRTMAGELTVAEGPVRDEYGTWISAYAPLKDSAGNIIALVGVDEDIRVFDYIQNTFRKMILFGFVGADLIGLAVIIVFSGLLTRNTKKIQHFLHNMAQGDLSSDLTVKANDEMGQIAKSLNEVCTDLNKMLYSVKECSGRLDRHASSLTGVSEEMASSSVTVADSVQEIAKSSSYQANELSSVSTALESFGQQLGQMVQGVSEIDSTANHINDRAVESNENLAKLVASIDGISTAFNNTTEKIKNLGLNINKINEISNLINSIADQTNLLALNASIEAARAGEAGRGFAVVAGEIKKLAEQSKSSSDSINELISNIVTDNETVGRTSQEVSGQLKSQIGVINTAIESFRSIVVSIETIIPQIDELDNYARAIDREKDSIVSRVIEVSHVAEGIAASSQEISASSQEMNAASEEVASTAEGLNEMTGDMLQRINRFKLAGK